MVVIYDNDINSVDEVIHVLMRATACTCEEAVTETWEAQAYGKAPVHFASRDECSQIASVIGSIGVRTDVAPEWE